MRVLVTGADGYIGKVLTRLLVDEASEHGRHEVVGLDTGFYADGWLGPNGKETSGEGASRTPRVPGVEMIRRDIRNVTPRDLEGADAIVHLAELSNDPLAMHNPELTFAINHKASLRLARLAKEAGVGRFVYASSCSVYGAGGAEARDEGSEANPQTAYAKCKVLVERDVSTLADQSFTPTFMRNATAYGASGRMRFDIVLNNLAGWAWTDKAIRMESDGMAWRPLVHVEDISRAVIHVLNAPREEVHNQVFNVGQDSDNFRVRELAEIIHGALPDTEVVLGEGGADNRSYRVSFKKIRDRLGFSCKHDVETGAKNLIAFFRDCELSKDRFEFRAFTRLKQLKYLIDEGRVDEQLFWRQA